MKSTLHSVARLDDTALLLEVKLLAARERGCTAHLIAALAEMDARKLYAGEGCSSLFTYCTQVLRLSEHAAYARIEAARAARRYPLLLQRLEAGDITLTTVTLLSPHLTSDNFDELLRSATHRSKREVEQLVATIRPKPDVPSLIRKLPDTRPLQPSLPREPALVARARVDTDGGSNDLTADLRTETVRAPSGRVPIVAPLAPERFKVQFTVSRETYDKLRRAQDLLRHCIPDGDMAEIFDRALTLLVAHAERTKLAAAGRPRRVASGESSSRYVPASVKRDVWARDGGQCAFIGTQGRCTERGFLEFHHVVPFAAGGKTSTDNLELRCRAHNLFEAERRASVFGTGALF